jgi:hypothetical protein
MSLVWFFFFIFVANFLGIIYTKKEISKIIPIFLGSS